MTSKELKKEFTQRLFNAEDGTMTLDDIDFANMLSTKFDLVHLHTQMSVKYWEIKTRTGKDNAALKENYELLERVSKLITKMELINREYSNELHELSRQNEYYKKMFPKVDFSKIKMHWNGQRVMYIKDFLK